MAGMLARRKVIKDAGAKSDDIWENGEAPVNYLNANTWIIINVPRPDIRMGHSKPARRIRKFVKLIFDQVHVVDQVSFPKEAT